MTRRSVIVGTGSYIPPVRVPNEAFLERDFRASDGSKLGKTNEEILEQFESITGIQERRYVADNVVTSEIAFEAAKDAIEVRRLGEVLVKGKTRPVVIYELLGLREPAAGH